MDINNRKKILLIINPCAGRKKSKAQLFDIAHIFTKAGFETTVYTTTVGGDATILANTLADKFDYIVCRGGDGTFGEIVSGIMPLERKPTIGYIPSGSTNDLAKSLNISPESKKSVELIFKGNAVPHDVGLLNNDYYFGYSVSFGAFTQCPYKTPQSMKNLFGHNAYLIGAFADLKDIKPIYAKYTSKEKSGEGYFCLGSVFNSTSIGGTIKVDKRLVKFDDGKFECMLIKYPKGVDNWFIMLKNLLTGNYDERYIEFFSTSEIDFTFSEPVPWTYDGEYAGAHENFNIKVFEKAITIFR